MNELEILDGLSAAADRQAVPTVDVADRVVNTLARACVQQVRAWPVAAAMAVASAAMFFLVTYAWHVAHNPMVELMDSVRLVMQ